MAGLSDFITSGGRQTAIPPNMAFPGTNRLVGEPSSLGINSQDALNAYSAMLWRESGGQSGSPMPPPEPPDPRIAQSNLRFQQASARAFGAGGGGGTGISFRNPVVGNAIQGNPVPVYSIYGNRNQNSGGNAIYGNSGGPINPGMTSTIKNPGQQSRLNANLAQYASGPLAQAKSQSLTEFTKSFLDDRAKQKEALDQELNYVGRTFSPDGLEADLSRNARERALLGRDAAQAAIRRAGRESSNARMVNGGVSSSYLDRAYGDILGRILMDNAMRGSDLNRENLMYLQGQRNSALGSRARLGSQYVQNALIPYDALTQAQGNDLSNLGRIANLEDSNTIYDYVTPDMAARRNLQLLSDLDRIKSYNA